MLVCPFSLEQPTSTNPELAEQASNADSRLAGSSCNPYLPGPPARATPMCATRTPCALLSAAMWQAIIVVSVGAAVDHRWRLRMESKLPSLMLCQRGEVFNLALAVECLPALLLLAGASRWIVLQQRDGVAVAACSHRAMPCEKQHLISAMITATVEPLTEVATRDGRGEALQAV